MSAINKGTS